MTKRKEIEMRIMVLEESIKGNRADIATMRERLVSMATNGTDFDITTFCPAYINDIKDYMARIQKDTEIISALKWAIEE